MAKESKKGLGTGLSALFNDDFMSEDESGELLYIALSKVEPRADQPRSYFDDEALQELSESIAQYGLIQPITVRKLESGYYQIIAGERRWRAARLAGLTEVPVRVIDADDRRVAELALVENLQREDLNPIEEARGYKALIEEYGLTQEEAARSVGKSRPAITNTMRLLTLCENVAALVEKNKLSAGHARALIPIENPELQLNLANQVIAGGLSVRKTEQMAAKALKNQREPQTEPKKDGEIFVDYAAEVAAELSQKLNRRVTVEQGKKRGKIVLEYYSDDDREMLINALMKMRKENEE